MAEKNDDRASGYELAFEEAGRAREPETVEFPLLQRDLPLHRSAAYDDNARRLGRLFSCASPAAPQPIKPSPMPGETHGSRNGGGR
jgi:hypothetical protein